ncbi:DUF5011 domain-containing protein [Lachnospiraceae bacterium MD1]|jgi:hypothetical protein|uniref:DUF5011 domain-containing protein n=1 Tax=Variimorphobacter saccharofermentans TaxID=2755051 RepID=A0A839K3S5_9FIRM|nr:L,D-transpeptidase family protein [Variimorphobacter saccharofermentans]MBB2183659.1 DUF5011 domain-containing protein [Variimorphobacter saccharofermentans]
MNMKTKRLLKMSIMILVCITMFLSFPVPQIAFAKVKYPYLIKVNRVHNTITVYEMDEAGKYTKPIKAMLCSVGVNGLTKTGTFQTKAKYRWKELMGDVYGQYSTRIVDGILFHSVYYYENGNPATLATNQFNKLGTAASHGCVRLSVADAKWIYDNCAVGTTVIIYDDKKSPGPLGKPEGIKISGNIRWDPTDPDKNNPYNSKIPTISGAKNLTVEYGNEADLLKGIKAKSSLGEDITKKINIEGKVDFYTSGKYKITYTVVDILGKVARKTITVTVKENKVKAEIEGVRDYIVNGDTVLDKEYLLKNVKAYRGEDPIAKEDIKVTIKNKSETEYAVTYRVDDGKDKVTANCTIYVDREAPVFEGISDRILEQGEIPDTASALSGVTVSDNYSDMDTDDITVTIEENEDGTYLITYKAVDDVGNAAEQQVLFHY